MHRTPTTGVLLWTGLVGYALLLIAERFIFVPGPNITVAWLGTGWLAAGLVVHHVRVWPLGLSITFFMTIVWYLTIYDSLLTDALWAATSTLLTALMIGGSVELFLRPEHRGAVAQYIFPLMALMTFLTMVGYGLGSYWWLTDRYSVEDSPLANALGICIGSATAASVGILLGMPVRRGLRRSTGRWFMTLLATAVLMVSASVAVARFPQNWFEILEPYQYTWRTLAVCGGVLLTLIAGPVQVAVTLLVMVIVVGALLKERVLSLPNAQEGLVVFVEGQALIVAITAITLLCTALMNSQRRTRRLAGANREIAQWVQQAHANIPKHLVHARISQIERALAVAGDYCGASVCAIYHCEALSRDEIVLSIEQVWTSADDPSVSTSVLSPTIDSRQHLGLRDQLLKRELWFLQAESKSRTSWATAFVEDLRLQVSIMPMAFDGALVGVLVMVSHPRARIRDFDVDSLLGTIRDHYLGYHNHAAAVRSMSLYQKQLRELTARLSDSAEQVRRQTSVELHDGLVQKLAVARMKLGELSIRKVSPPETINAITEIVDDALSETRGIIRDLSTSVLYELGLIPALQELTQTLDQVGDVAISLEEKGERVHLSEPLRVMIFTTIRELIENARLHADCSNLWIVVHWDNVRGISSIEVSDDGTEQGWWLGKSVSADLGLGIAGVSEQLRRFGYELKFDFRPGGGTRAVIT
ncbi:MAG: histidine kinase [Pseudomonadota bacterium]